MSTGNVVSETQEISAMECQQVDFHVAPLAVLRSVGSGFKMLAFLMEPEQIDLNEPSPPKARKEVEL